MRKELLIKILCRILEEIELGDVSDDDMYTIWYKKCLCDVAEFLDVSLPNNK